MDQEIKNKLEAQAVKIDAIYASVEKTRKYFVWTLWITLITFVLPLLILSVVGPALFGSYMNTLTVPGL